jgi:hypothetical protein
VLYLVAGIPVAVVAAWWWRREAVRTARLRRCAQERRLRFSRHDILDVHQRYGALALMRLGHSRRAWDTFFGMHEHGVWLGFFDCCDLGFAADRFAIRRCVATLEIHTGVEAVCLPAAAAVREPSFFRTAVDYLGFRPVAAAGPDGSNMPDASCAAADPGRAEAVDGRRDADSGRIGAPGSHILYVRRPSAAHSPVVARLVRAISRYPDDWAWELGEEVLAAVRTLSARESGCGVISVMLDAVADVAARLSETSPRERCTAPLGRADNPAAGA